VRPFDEVTKQLLQGASFSSFYRGSADGSDWGDAEDDAAGWSGRRVYG
jgi:hypothetical protein